MDEKSLPPCAVCAGRVPASVGDEVGEDSQITVQAIYYKYPGDVRSEAPGIASPNFSVIEQSYRFRDLRSGAMAELHYCFDSARLVISLKAHLPHDDREKARLDFFFNYAQKLQENRGRKGKITIEQLYDAIRRRPKASLTWLASELNMPSRTLQYFLKSEGLTLKEARTRARR